jgi:hypothetical protein
MKAAYAKAPLDTASAFWNWSKYSTQPYQSATHGQRYVHNFANEKAAAYGKYEKAGKLPVGAQIAKPSFTVGQDGRASVGPLFVMEKMPRGFLAESGDWKYTMVMPDGSVFGQTRGKNSAGMQFCIACHQAAADKDHLMFLPEEYRVSR